MVSCIIDLLPVYVWWYCFTVQYGWYLLVPTTTTTNYYVTTTTTTTYWYQYLPAGTTVPGTCWVWYWYQYLLTGGGTCTGMVLVPTYYQYQLATSSCMYHTWSWNLYTHYYFWEATEYASQGVSW